MKNNFLSSRRLVIVIPLLLLLLNIIIPSGIGEANTIGTAINTVKTKENYIIDKNNKTISGSIEENEKSEKLPQTTTKNYTIIFFGFIVLTFGAIISIKTSKTNL